MFSQKGGTSPLAEKRIIYSLIKRGIFGRRSYSESTFLKKRTGIHEQYERPSSSHANTAIATSTPMPAVPTLEMVELTPRFCPQAH